VVATGGPELADRVEAEGYAAYAPGEVDQEEEGDSTVDASASALRGLL
jgi:hypothetical protein